MSLPRVVAPETLDGLAADDPSAMRSRRDLRRVHRFMGTVSIVSRAMRTMEVVRRPAPLRILEIGAGDGTLMLAVARALGRTDARVALTLLDRLALVDDATVTAYERAGWRADVATVDIVDWTNAGTGHASPPDAARWDLIVANLFLHHFDGSRLALILDAIASRSDRLFACEPRRERLALVASHLTGLIGANAVTREDAVLSVHAGFRDLELTSVWAATQRGWDLDEYRAGLFSHCFHAVRGPAR